MSRRGVTLVELLMVAVISSIGFVALALPFAAERSMWGNGKRQSEAQRDAQMALRAIARVARESLAYSVVNPGPNQGAVGFDQPGGATGIDTCVRGGPSDNFQLTVRPSCNGAISQVLIDGVRSRIASFRVVPVVPNQQLRIELLVRHRLRQNDTRENEELLITEVYLRNGV